MEGGFNTPLPPVGTPPVYYDIFPVYYIRFTTKSEMSIVPRVRIGMVLQRIVKGTVFGRIYYEQSNGDRSKRCVFDGCATYCQPSIVPRGVYLNAAFPRSRPNS